MEIIFSNGTRDALTPKHFEDKKQLEAVILFFDDEGRKNASEKFGPSL